MKTHAISRRELLKNSGALVVSFSLFGPAARALAPAVEGAAVGAAVASRSSRSSEAELHILSALGDDEHITVEFALGNRRRASVPSATNEG